MLRDLPDGCQLTIRVTPKASRAELLPPAGPGEPPRLKVPAPPVEGAANAACVKFLAKALGVGKGRVQLIRGEKSREKTFHLEGISAAEAGKSLGLIL